MNRGFRLAIGMLATLAVLAGTANAQYGYTYPWAAGGWGGWGASTVGGDMARGLGVYAAGVGQYNLATAQAAAIEGQAIMNWNQYMFEAQQYRNYRYHQQLIARQKVADRSLAERYKRLRGNPDERDIRTGDALNVALDDVTNPKVYLDSLKEAQTPIPTTLIRQIPFNAASEAITLSFSELLNRDNWPAVLKTDATKDERAKLRQLAQEAAKEDEEGDLKPETIKGLQDAVAAYRAKFEATFPKGSKEYREGLPYLKGLTGLSQMLEQPKVQELLRDVEKVKERPLSDLLAFMYAFNLRFGPAQTPQQVAAYRQLFPILDNLRDAVAASMAGTTPADEFSNGNAAHAANIFSPVPDEQLDAHPNELPPVPDFKPGETKP